jgi:hypothetical protein
MGLLWINKGAGMGNTPSLPLVEHGHKVDVVVNEMMEDISWQ